MHKLSDIFAALYQFHQKGSHLLAALTSLIKGGYFSGEEIKSTAGYLVSMYDPFSLALGGKDHNK